MRQRRWGTKMTNAWHVERIPEIEYPDGTIVPETMQVKFNGMEVLIGLSAVDEKPCVQVYTEEAEEQDIRIILNDGDLWDQSTEAPWENGTAL